MRNRVKDLILLRRRLRADLAITAIALLSTGAAYKLMSPTFSAATYMNQVKGRGSRGGGAGQADRYFPTAAARWTGKGRTEQPLVGWLRPCRVMCSTPETIQNMGGGEGYNL